MTIFTFDCIPSLPYLGVSVIPEACTAAVSGPGFDMLVHGARRLAKSALSIRKSPEVHKKCFYSAYNFFVCS